jgi:uncharacterized membrane protein
VLVLFAGGLAADRLLRLDDRAVAARTMTICCVAGCALTTAVAALRILWLGDPRYGQDTAYAANILWNTLHGRFLRSELLQDLLHVPPLSSDFGAHNSPLQLLLLPLYAAWPSPLMLIVARNVALWLAPGLLFRHLEPRTGPRPALFVALSLAVQATVLWQSVGAFYFGQLALPVLVLVLAGWERRSLRAALAAIAVALLVREDLALAAFALAVIAALQRRGWGWIAAPAVMGISWWFVSTRIVMPAAGGGAGGAVASTLREVGATPGALAAAALREPGAFIARFASAENLEMLRGLGGSVGWLGLLSPGIIVAAPFEAANALVRFSPAKDVFMHYHLVAVPFLILGAWKWIERAARWMAPGDARLAGTFALGLLCAIAAADIRVLPVRETMSALSPAGGTLRRAAEEAVGDASSVAAPGAFLPSLANRPSLYLSTRLDGYPGHPCPDALVYDPDLRRANPLPSDSGRYRRFLGEALSGGYVRVATLVDSVVVLRRQPDG